MAETVVTTVPGSISRVLALLSTAVYLNRILKETAVWYYVSVPISLYIESYNLTGQNRCRKW